MQIIGVDLHARQQTVAMLNVETGELVEKTLKHEGGGVREFYSTLAGPIRVGIEATGSMQWFLELMEELGIDCRVGHPAKMRAAEPRKQKNDRRDAALILKLLAENRFPSIWMPSSEQRDVRALLLHRRQWVRIRTRVQNALQAIALSHGLRRGSSLWSQAGQQAIASLRTRTGNVAMCAWQCDEKRTLPRWPWPENSRFGCTGCGGTVGTIRGWSSSVRTRESSVPDMA
jgi:transposase